MRLDFNILWVDDQPGRVLSTKERIESLVRREGFRLRVEFAESIEKAKEYLADDIYGDHIDLILMDYDLGAGGRGDDGLVEVRNVFQYKDVVFYSSQASDLPRLVAEKQLQGIFCSTRDSLHETVHGVFDALMKKVLDIDHSRGIVMGATSDIDHHVNDCLARTFDKGDEDSRSLAFKTVARHLRDKSESLEQERGKIAGLSHVADLVDFPHVYTSNDRLRLLKTMFESGGLQRDILPAIKEYLNRTVPMRNDLAHVRVETVGFSRKLYDRHGNELTNEQMKALRQDLLQFQELVEKLSSDLSAD